MPELTDVCNFSDDATFHACDSGLEELVKMLQHDVNLPIGSFDCNYMRMNEDEYHLIIFGNKSEAVRVKIGQTKILESKKQKLLGVITDPELSCDEYLISLCNNSGKKLSNLGRLANFLSLEQRNLLMKSFIKSQFGYCLLKCFFLGKKTNARINHVHDRALRIVYRNNSLCFDELLKIDKSYNIHHKNISISKRTL